MRAYKAFDKGLKCRGYQFTEGEVNVTDAANCAQNGFHAATNPLDCLKYYPNFAGSEFCVVDVFGDVDEDAIDSKITGTHMRIVRRLSHRLFLMHCVLYCHANREAQEHCIVQRERGTAHNGYVIVIGREPLAKGDKVGDILAMGQIDEKGEIKMASTFVVGEDVPIGKYVYATGREEKNRG